jgi:intracellular sulfur oxidation DsrE/DsrF family protein
MRGTKRLALALPLLFCGLANADPVEQLLARSTAPAGVVFEVVQGQRAALDWAVPLIGDYAQRLRQRFPGLPIAVVTHGAEQFALTRASAEATPALHGAVRQLVQADGIPVHVCGTHASWFDVSAEDFPDYVDVAPSAPAQIRAYRELGYELVVVSRPG